MLACRQAGREARALLDPVRRKHLLEIHDIKNNVKNRDGIKNKDDIKHRDESWFHGYIPFVHVPLLVLSEFLPLEKSPIDMIGIAPEVELGTLDKFDV